MIDRLLQVIELAVIVYIAIIDRRLLIVAQRERDALSNYIRARLVWYEKRAGKPKEGPPHGAGGPSNVA